MSCSKDKEISRNSVFIVLKKLFFLIIYFPQKNCFVGIYMSFFVVEFFLFFVFSFLARGSDPGNNFLMSSFIEMVETVENTGGIESLRARPRNATEEDFLNQILFITSIHETDLIEAYAWLNTNKTGWRRHYYNRMMEENVCKQMRRLCILKSSLWHRLVNSHRPSSTWIPLKQADGFVRLRDSMSSKLLLNVLRNLDLVWFWRVDDITSWRPLRYFFPRTPPPLPIGESRLDKWPVEPRISVWRRLFLGNKASNSVPIGLDNYLLYIGHSMYLPIEIFRTMMTFASGRADNNSARSASEIIAAIEMSAPRESFAPELLVIWYDILTTGKGEFLIDDNATVLKMSDSTWTEFVLNPCLQRLIKYGYET